MNEQEGFVYSVYVGIDWANSKHDVCVQKANSDTREFNVIQHRPEAKETSEHVRFHHFFACSFGVSLFYTKHYKCWLFCYAKLQFAVFDKDIGSGTLFA